MCCSEGWRPQVLFVMQQRERSKRQTPRTDFSIITAACPKLRDRTGLRNTERSPFCPPCLFHCTGAGGALPAPRHHPLQPTGHSLPRNEIIPEHRCQIRVSGTPVLHSATPNYPSSLSVWALPLPRTRSPVNTHRKWTLSLHSALCVYGGILRKWTRGHRHVKMTTNAWRLSLGVSSIFSSFAFIFGPFAFLCDCLHLYLVILWIILVFFESIFSHFASLCAFVAVLHLTKSGLRVFHDASRWGLLQVFTSQFFHRTTFGLCLFLVTLHMFVLILCPLSVSFAPF